MSIGTAPEKLSLRTKLMYGSGDAGIYSLYLEKKLPVTPEVSGEEAS